MLQTQVIHVITRNRDRKVLAIEIANESIHTIIRCKNIIASDDYPFTEVMTEIQPIYGKVLHGIYLFTGNNREEQEETVNVKDLREIVVLPANGSHRAIYLLVVYLVSFLEMQLNEEFKMTAPQESLIHAYMETEIVDESSIDSFYSMMDTAVQDYLNQLSSSVPISILYTCHYVEVDHVNAVQLR